MAFSFNQGDRPLEGYTIQRGVGRGGFGEVYHALSDGGKEVALKYLRENPQVELRGVQHCLNLKSPHLVAIHDVKQSADGDWFVIMEYVAGPSLRDLLLDAPRGLGAQKAAYFLREMGKGLTYLHDRGIVHRDMKPGNLFYEDGYVKIGDYGLSKVMSPSQHSGQTMSVGTVHYMAPEVGSGNYSKTIDIYAVGVILYEMLLGRVPYQGATMGEVLMKHLTAQPEVDELPAPFPQVIRKALAKDPADRYQNMAEMVNEVFAAADMENSVNTFEPASLTAVAARVVKASIESPSPAPRAAGQTGEPGRPRPRPIHGSAVQGLAPLGSGSSNVGTFAAETIAAPRHDRAEQSKPARDADDVPAAPRPTLNRRTGEKLVLAFLITAGVSLAAAWLAGGGRITPAIVPVTFAYVASLVGGALLGTYVSFFRIRHVGYWPHRFINAGCCTALLGAMMLLATPLWVTSYRVSDAGSSWPLGVAAAMAQAPQAEENRARRGNDVTRALESFEPKGNSLQTSPTRSSRGGAAVSRTTNQAVYYGQPARRGTEPWNWAPPLLLLVLLGDWSGRVYRGRQGQIDTSWAISAAIFGFIAAKFMGAGEHDKVVAIIAAAASVAVQLAANLWPMRHGERIPQTSRSRPAGVFMDPEGGNIVMAMPAMEAARADSGRVDSDHVGVEREPLRRVPPVLAPLHAAPSMEDPSPRIREALSPLKAAERSQMARTLWLLAGMLLVFGSITLFICYGTDVFHRADEATAACASALAAGLLGLFGISRSIGRQRHGLWRGVLRPFIFTLGLAGSGASAIVMGHLKWIYQGGPHGWTARDTANMNEAWIISIICLLGGLFMSLFVWFVPVAPFVEKAAPVVTDENGRMRRRVRWFVAGAFGLAAVMGITAVIISETLRGTDEEIVMAVTMIPMGLGFVGCIVAAAMTQAKLTQKPGVKPEKLKLPVQHSFHVPRVGDLDDLILRHFMLMGYKPANRARLLWSFERGNWSQLWQSDVRKHRTTVNVAAYEISDGYRITCLTDVDNVWNPPGKKELAVLMDELRGLEELLNGAAVESAVARK